MIHEAGKAAKQSGSIHTRGGKNKPAEKPKKKNYHSQADL
jgi:hypothetical protein